MNEKTFELLRYVLSVPDFPEKGVMFRDISPLMAQKMPETIREFAKLFEKDEIAATTAFAGIDSRGFIFASALAMHFNKNLVLVRKAGKLPPPIFQESYSLEYGTASLEMAPGFGTVILVDDVLATGGTLMAAANLCQRSGYEVKAIAALINLPALNNFEWQGQKARSLFEF